MPQVVCIIENMDLRELGAGKSKKIAKRVAAQAMLNKLRKENLDKVDELLDRLPRTAAKGAAFDLVAEITNLKKNRDSVPKEDQLLTTFYHDLIEDKSKMDQLKAVFANDMKRYIQEYMQEDRIIPDVEKLTERISALLNCAFDLSVYPEKRDDGKFQCLAEFVARDPKYHSVSILTSYGADEDYQQAKLKTLSRCILVLLCSIV